MSPTDIRPRPQQGFVLIVTLWVLVILGVMLTYLGYQARVESAVERWALNHSQLRWAARGALHTAAARVREHLQDEFHTPAAPWWSDEDVYREQPYGDVTVSILGPATGSATDAAIDPTTEKEQTYGLDDEESRLNINVAHPDHLMGFPGVSSVVAEAIVLFRLEREEALAEAAQLRGDRSDEPSPSADPEDRDANDSVDGPIRSLRELLAVDEVTEALLFEPHDERPPLAELLTTMSSGKVNVNSASAPVLRAIGFGEDAVAILLERRRDEETAVRSVDEAVALLDADMHQKKRARTEKLLAVRSLTFRLTAEARLPNRPRAHVAEALLRGGDKTMAFVRWREG